MTKLFCFSIAGGSSDLFNCLDPFLSPDTHVIKMEYAGHGVRMREPFYADMDAMTEDMYAVMAQSLNSSDNYIMFGYSMGSMVLSATLKMIIDRGELPTPKHVFLAAHAPNISNHSLSKEELDDDEKFRAHIVHFGGVPEDIANSKIFWHLYMPIYRTDYRLMSLFDFRKFRLNTTIPATVIYCEEDTPLSDLRVWLNFFKGVCSFYEFDGGHFFIKKHSEDIAKLLRNINE